jgi:hypothetical protein
MSESIPAFFDRSTRRETLSDGTLLFMLKETGNAKKYYWKVDEYTPITIYQLYYMFPGENYVIVGTVYPTQKSDHALESFFFGAWNKEMPQPKAEEVERFAESCVKLADVLDVMQA